MDHPSEGKIYVSEKEITKFDDKNLLYTEEII